MLLLVSALTLALIESSNTGNQVAMSETDQPLATIPGGGVGAVEGDNVTAAVTNGHNNLLWSRFADGSSFIGQWTFHSEMQCGGLVWKVPSNHIYFQIGNGFLLLAFLAPNTLAGMMWLRLWLAIGCVMLIMWGWLIECSIDIVLWFGWFLLINVLHTIVLIVRLRPIKFEKDMEAVYVSLFKPLRVSRKQFQKVLRCMKLIRFLKYQEIYAQEKVTKVDSLSLVLSGKLVVSQNQRALHIVFPHQFLDSPEWFGVSTDDYFQVSIMAMEESKVLIWHRDKLKLSIMTEPFLQVVFDHILGRDVVKKLMQVTQVSETMAASNGFITAGYEDGDDKPMLLIKNANDGHGLTALINRQLQDEYIPLLSDPPPCLTPRHHLQNKGRPNSSEAVSNARPNDRTSLC